MVGKFSEEEKQTIWDMREAGVPVKRIAPHLGGRRSGLLRPPHSSENRISCPCNSLARAPSLAQRSGIRRIRVKVGPINADVALTLNSETLTGWLGSHRPSMA